MLLNKHLLARFISQQRLSLTLVGRISYKKCVHSVCMCLCSLSYFSKAVLMNLLFFLLIFIELNHVIQISLRPI